MKSQKKKTKTKPLQKKTDKEEAKIGLSSSTIIKINNILLHGALEQAMKNQLILRNPVDATTLPKHKQKEIRVLTVDEQKVFIKALEGERLRAAFILSLGSGLRLGELLALTWDNTDLKEGIITIKKSLARVKTNAGIGKKTELIVQDSKTKSGNRVIPLPDEIITVLKRHKNDQLEERRKAFGSYENNNLVFCTELGGFIEPRNFMQSFYSLCEKAGVPRTNVHAMWHTFATRMLEA